MQFNISQSQQNRGGGSTIPKILNVLQGQISIMNELGIFLASFRLLRGG